MLIETRVRTSSLALVVLGALLGNYFPSRTPNGTDDLGAQASALIEQRCAKCHDHGKAKGGFGSILDFAKLREARNKDGTSYLVPGDADKSLIWERVGVLGDMPEDAPDGLPQADRELLKRWIEAGAPPPGAAPPTRARIDERSVIRAIKADVEDLETDEERTAMRYFTLTHLWNLGGRDAEQLPVYRAGFYKLLNSLSRAPAIHAPHVVANTQETVFRVDLRGLGWTKADWQAIEDRYPYFFTKKDSEAFFQVVGVFTKAEVPVVRADWFAAEASREPLYGLLLHHPADLASLESDLGVDVAANLASGKVARAGFLRSGVSDFNRLIERHAIARYEGAYWKSYDFAGNDGAKNLRARPFGPPGVTSFLGFRPSDEVLFVHDGGEVIYHLRNGLQAYVLADGAGKIIPRAPIGIVGDPARGEVENALSCMQCHARGIRTDARRDEVLPTARLSQNFDNAAMTALTALHADEAKLNALYSADSARFENALERLGLKPTGTNDEPIARLVERFEDFVRIEQAAEEIGVSKEFILAQFKDAPDLRQIAADLQVGGLPRKSFIREFRRVAEASKLGAVKMPRIEGELGERERPTEVQASSRTETIRRTLDWAETLEFDADPNVVTNADFLQRIRATGLPWRVRERVSKIQMLLVPAGSYKRGASPGDSEASSDEKPAHNVTITKAFYLGRYEVMQSEWTRVFDQIDEPLALGAPRTGVSFHDIFQFFEVVNGAKPGGLRLPTEGEWEYACRAGAVGARYGDIDAIAWCSDNSRNYFSGVGQKQGNSLGLHDMLGNQSEWCGDYYDPNEYGRCRSGVEDPTGPEFGRDRVIRGGSSGDLTAKCRASWRESHSPMAVVAGITTVSVNHGFRVARRP